MFCFVLLVELNLDFAGKLSNMASRFSADIIDDQRQQLEERAIKMESVLVNTTEELSDARKQVSYFLSIIHIGTPISTCASSGFLLFRLKNDLR